MKTDENIPFLCQFLLSLKYGKKKNILDLNLTVLVKICMG